MALADGYLTSDAHVPIFGGDTSESIFGRVLGALYDILIANRPMAVENPALRDAQVLVRATRVPTGGANVSVLGVGMGMTQGTTVLTPRDLMIDGPRVVRDLSRFVQSSDARGVLLHLNNLENLTEAGVENAADLLRDLRDPLLMQNGLHFIFVGMPEAIDTLVNTHQQVRHTVSTLRLAPLPVAEVHAMLNARYAHLRLDPKRPVATPVEPEAVALLYELFRGDLRGLLKALEAGIEPLLGLPSEHDSTAGRPVTAEELRSTLRARYLADLAAQLEPTRIEQLTVWGQKDSTSTQTQKTLKALWKLNSQGGVSYAIGALVRQGYAFALPRVGTEPIQYVLSGTSRLIFG
jgi:hypothetical protein